VAARAFRPEELEQIAAPIALYADSFLAQVLMASTYPLEVVMAARFIQANPTLTGEPLNEALRTKEWDDSVKSIVMFPQVLNMMNDRLDWTQKLGDAFLGQRQELMDAIQRLRARAQAQGTLATTPQQTVTVEPGPPAPTIWIESAVPEVVYVPVYDPWVVYGPWPYALYPPYYYYPPGWLAGGVFFTFGVGVFVGAGLWGYCDWHHHVVHVHIPRYDRFRQAVGGERRDGRLDRGRPGPPDGDRIPWEHDPQHRRGVEYRDAGSQQRFGRTGVPNAAAREVFRGRAAEGRAELERGTAPPSRPGIPVTPRPESGARQPGGSLGVSPGLGPLREPGAFQGLGRGPEVQTYSERGRESLRSIVPPSPGIRVAPPRITPRGVPGGGAPGGRQRR
jgi:hypothetical protein